MSIDVERGVINADGSRALVPSSVEEMMASTAPAPDRYLKQVIVMRKDLSMPHGKFAAMASHASMTFILERLGLNTFIDPVLKNGISRGVGVDGVFTHDEWRWMTELDPGIEETGQRSMAKIVVMAQDLTELQAVEDAARMRGLTVCRVLDSGFSHNAPGTFVGIAIGPAWPEAFEGVTDHLKLR